MYNLFTIEININRPAKPKKMQALSAKFCRATSLKSKSTPQMLANIPLTHSSNTETTVESSVAVIPTRLISPFIHSSENKDTCNCKDWINEELQH